MGEEHIGNGRKDGMKRQKRKRKPRYYVNGKPDFYWEVVDRTSDTVVANLCKSADDSNRADAQAIADAWNKVGSRRAKQLARLTPPKPAELWALWNPTGGMDCRGNWVPPFDDPPIKDEQMMCFMSEADGKLAAQHQKDLYDIDCYPVRVK